MAKTILGKHSAPIALLAVLLLTISLGSAWHVHSFQQSASLALENNVASMQASKNLEISLRTIATHFNRFLVTRDESFLTQMPELRTLTERVFLEAENLAGTEPEKDLMAAARGGYSHFLEQYNQILKEPDRWKYPRIIHIADGILHNEILGPVHQYLQLNESMLASSSENNRQGARRLTVGLIMIGLGGSLGGIMAGTVLSNALNKALAKKEEQLRQTANKLQQAAGPLESDNAKNPIPAQDALEQVRHSATAVLEKLKQTQLEALRSEQLAMVGQMAAGLAHEIRNPLTTIKLIIQKALERAELSVFRPRDLDVLEEEIIRLENIVKGFLDFARPPRPETRAVNLAELGARTIDILKQRAQLNGVQLTLNEPEKDIIAQVDPEQVRQILYNLLFNALEAMPGGGIVETSIQLQDSTPEPQVVISVIDNGPGVPVSQRSKIFDPFFSTKETGLGLGLSICKRIAESHGGTLCHDSKAGKTIFTLTIPANLRIPDESPDSRVGAA